MLTAAKGLESDAPHERAARSALGGNTMRLARRGLVALSLNGGALAILGYEREDPRERTVFAPVRLEA